MTHTSSQTTSVPVLKAQGLATRPQRAVFYGWWIVEHRLSDFSGARL
jgi:hypothetical protein